jgi:FkbM family methyltransferase
MKLLEKIALWFFDLIDKYLHQKNILNALKKESLKIETFIDIGAHKGKYTDLILNNYNVKKAYMFEPQKEIFNSTKNKFKRNKIVNIYNYGISNKNEQRTFFINKHNLTSSLKKLNPKNLYLNLKSKLFSTDFEGMVMKKLKIKTKKLNNFIKEKKIKNIDLVKIDTEGHELEVLLGIGKEIKNIKAFLIEFHDNKTYLNYNSKSIENILNKNNFMLKKKLNFHSLNGKIGFI